MYPLLVPCVPSGPANISMVWVEAEPLHFLFHHFGVLNDLWSFNSKKRAVPLRGTARFLLCFVVLFVFLEPTAPKLVGEDIWTNYFQNWKEDYIIIFSGAAKRASLLGCRTTSKFFAIEEREIATDRMDTIYTPHFWNFRPPSFRIFWFRSILKYEEHPSWRSLKRAKIGLLDKIRPLFWRFSTSPHFVQDFQNLRRMKDADFQKIGRMIEKKLKHHFRFFPAMICICSRARSSCFLCDLHGSLSNVVSQVFSEFFSEVSFKIWLIFSQKFRIFWVLRDFRW